jgi:L-threonylcarbamoyladenylate synthase
MFNTEIGTDIVIAASWLKKNEAVAIPTETVYGLAANAFNAIAVAKIFSIKNRPTSNPLILHVANVDAIKNLTSFIPDIAYDLIKAFSPGPLTFLLPKNNKVLNIVNNGLNEVAIRIPNHPLTLQLLNSLDFPLAAPSANPFGYISPTNAQHVFYQLQNKIPYILNGGECDKGIESTVIGFNKDIPIIYRPGIITQEAIEKITGSCFIKDTASEIISPGMLPYHYSPATPFHLVNTESEIEELANNTKQIGALCYQKKYSFIPSQQQLLLSKTGNLDEAAKNLYAALIELDRMKLSIIVSEKLPNNGLGKIINERLQKAAAKYNG